jgi:hypothetical protein
LLTHKVFKYESADAVLVINEENRVAAVTNVFSRIHKQGHATGLMKLIVEYADAESMDLRLRAQQYGSATGLNNKQLVDFYKKFGFAREESDKPGFMMIRRHNYVTGVTEVTNVTGVTPSRDSQGL